MAAPRLTLLLAGLLAASAALPVRAESPAAPRAAAPAQDDATWMTLKGDVVGDRPILDGAGLVALEAPYRAEDAAVVPIGVKASFKDGRTAKGLTLVIDENPSPVVAKFTFGPSMGDIDLSTRVRVNAYSNVRAIVEASDGQLYMTAVHVKASGGCSAPALKDADQAAAHLGDLKTRWFPAKSEPAASGQWREAQIMIRHPNYSGLQMNQVTRMYIPAHFVDEIEARQGDDLLFRIEGGISFSENPSLRFRYRDNGAKTLEVKAKDTDGKTFEKSFEVERGA